MIVLNRSIIIAHERICSIWTLRPDTSPLWILLLSSQHMMLTAQMIRMAGKCLIYAQSKLSALNRPCSVSFIIQSQLLPLVLHVFEHSLKCDDNSHKRRDKNCHLQQNASLPLLIFFCSGFSCCVFDKKAGPLDNTCAGTLLTVCHGCCPPPTSVTQLASRFSLS